MIVYILTSKGYDKVRGLNTVIHFTLAMDYNNIKIDRKFRLVCKKLSAMMTDCATFVMFHDILIIILKIITILSLTRRKIPRC